MENKNVFTKENIILYIVVMMQIFALTFYVQFAKMYVEQRQLFQRTGEFEEVSAECVKVEERDLSHKANSSSVYNNTYEYEVDGEVYTATFYGEFSKGEDDLLYYNPDAPETCSRYSSLSDAVAEWTGRLVIVLVMQVAVIVYAVWRWKTNEER